MDYTRYVGPYISWKAIHMVEKFDGIPGESILSMRTFIYLGNKTSDTHNEEKVVTSRRSSIVHYLSWS